MDSTQFIGERLKLVRLANDIRQADLAASLNLLSNSLVSKIENGRQAVDDETIAQFALALGCNASLLKRPAPDVMVTRPWLRAYADAKSKTVESITADNILHHELVELLKLKRVAVSFPVFDADLNDDEAIEDFAIEVREAADIDASAVVGNAMRAAERLGCVILPLGDELGRHLGMSQFVDGVPYIRVSRPANESRTGVPGDRQRFTVAHELGHLTLHADLPPPQNAEQARRIERQAHRFAAAFLAPADPIMEDLEAAGGRVTLNTLKALKSRWGISIKGLVVRFRHLRVIDEDQATALYKQISRLGYNRVEPVTVSNETPIWFARALNKKWPNGDAITAAALEHGLGVKQVRRWLDWTDDLGDDAAVVHLDDRQSRRNTPTETVRDGAAEISWLGTGR